MRPPCWWGRRQTSYLLLDPDLLARAGTRLEHRKPVLPDGILARLLRGSMEWDGGYDKDDDGFYIPVPGDIFMLTDGKRDYFFVDPLPKRTSTRFATIPSEIRLRARETMVRRGEALPQQVTMFSLSATMMVPDIIPVAWHSIVFQDFPMVPGTAMFDEDKCVTAVFDEDKYGLLSAQTVIDLSAGLGEEAKAALRNMGLCLRDSQRYLTQWTLTQMGTEASPLYKRTIVVESTSTAKSDRAESKKTIVTNATPERPKKAKKDGDDEEGDEVDDTPKKKIKDEQAERL